MIRPAGLQAHDACESGTSQVSGPKLSGAIRLLRGLWRILDAKSLQTRRGPPDIAASRLAGADQGVPGLGAADCGFAAAS